MPETTEYFYLASRTALTKWRGICRDCHNRKTNSYHAEHRAIAKEVARAKVSRFSPRVVGADGPSGGYSEGQQEGYRVAWLPDSHGRDIDWPAAEAALAGVRYYRPALVVLLGDHVDLCSVSRFRKSPEQRFSMGQDIEEARKFLAKVRESAGPDARIVYLKGNHEARLQHYIWEHADALDGLEGLTVPAQLRLSDHSIEWIETGTLAHSPVFMSKHGNAVRKRSGASALAEIERNGISGVSGHTHRLGQTYVRTRLGVAVWNESGCLCNLDPDYADGQIMDWQHGLTFGTISTSSHRFSTFLAPIIGGKVLIEGREIGP